MLQPGRSYSAGNGYRYGFNGKENDDEVKGEGNQQDYGMRIYDPRLGKFLSVDPLTRDYPEFSPYHYAENCPIKFIDLDGAESSDPNIKPSGITYISKATVPYGLMEEKAAFAAGNYLIYKTNASGEGGDFYTARLYQKEGKYKGMYQDDWIIGPESVSKFISNAKEYEKRASYVCLGYNMGGTSDFSPGGLVNVAKDTWTPVNILFGISILGKGFVGMMESNPRPTWQQSERDILNENPGYREQVPFKNGNEVAPNTKGSVRPEGYKVGSSIEVKNYKVTTESGQKSLINNVVKQVRQRMSNLPKGTHQTVILDFRGLKFKSSADMMRTFMKVRSGIVTQTGTSSVTVGLKYSK